MTYNNGRIVPRERCCLVCLHAVLEEMESGMGVTNRLEELRKKEGEDWLSILNRKQGQVSLL